MESKSIYAVDENSKRERTSFEETLTRIDASLKQLMIAANHASDIRARLVGTIEANDQRVAPDGPTSVPTTYEQKLNSIANRLESAVIHLDREIDQIARF